jgi:F-type H+-transporting ATPase subunit a
MSNKEGFMHGETTEVDGSYYKLHHEKIYKTDAAGNLTFDKKVMLLRKSFRSFNYEKCSYYFTVFYVVIVYRNGKSYKKSQFLQVQLRF